MIERRISQVWIRQVDVGLALVIAGALATLVTLVTFSACGGASSNVSSTVPSTSAATPLPHFAYQAVDGRPISSESLFNRVSVIAFLTTYDVHSQAEARSLASLGRLHSPRINVAALVLEAPENRPLVEAFATSLGLGYPVALVDAATIAGEGPFAGLHHVPSIVVLDRAGHEAWRHVGFVTEGALEAAVRAVEAASPPPREVPP